MIEGQGVMAVHRAPFGARFDVMNRGHLRRDILLESKRWQSFSIYSAGSADLPMKFRLAEKKGIAQRVRRI